jgi:hypothetical protein
MREISPLTLQLPEARQTSVGTQVKPRPEGPVSDDIWILVHENQRCQVQELLEATLREGLVCIQ